MKWLLVDTFPLPTPYPLVTGQKTHTECAACKSTQRYTHTHTCTHDPMPKFLSTELAMPTTLWALQQGRAVRECRVYLALCNAHTRTLPAYLSSPPSLEWFPLAYLIIINHIPNWPKLFKSKKKKRFETDNCRLNRIDFEFWTNATFMLRIFQRKNCTLHLWNYGEYLGKIYMVKFPENSCNFQDLISNISHNVTKCDKFV